jgi:hypothetical protein
MIGIFGFFSYMQESKCVFVFSDLNDVEIKVHVNALERCFL